MSQVPFAGISRLGDPNDVEQDEEQDRPKPSPDAGFCFLNFSNFNDTKAKETKSRVRSHVMHGVHQKKKSGKQRRPKGSIELDTYSLLRSKPQSTQVQPDHALPDAALFSPDRLGAGRNDPFQQFPIQMNRRTMELYDHLVTGPFCPMFKTMSRIGFYRSITDPAGFLQILSTSVSHMTMLRHQPVAESPEAIALSTRALEYVNKRLGDPILNTSDGVVVAILTFCCHTTMFNDAPGSKTHMKGLEEIIRRRGGAGTLDSNPAMRMVLFWVDTNYAFMADTVPRFPYPEDLYPVIDVQPHNDHLPLVEACNDEALTSAFHDLYSLNQLIINEAQARDIWADGVFAWKYMVPVLHKLLLIKYEQLGPGSAGLRAGAILYIAAIRRRFGVRFLTNVQIRRLRVSMTVLLQDADSDPIGYDAAASILLWLLVLGSTLSDLKEDHDWFVSRTAQHIFTMGHVSWDEAVGSSVRKVLWIDEILVDEVEALRQEVSRTLLNSSLRQFS